MRYSMVARRLHESWKGRKGDCKNASFETERRLIEFKFESGSGLTGFSRIESCIWHFQESPPGKKKTKFCFEIKNFIFLSLSHSHTHIPSLSHALTISSTFFFLFFSLPPSLSILLYLHLSLSLSCCCPLFLSYSLNLAFFLSIALTVWLSLSFCLPQLDSIKAG